MTKDKFYLWLFYLIPLVYFFSLPIATGDLAVWAAQGNHMLSTHSILRHDIYSVLPTGELIYPVGICLLYGLIYNVGGLVSVSVFHKVILLIIHFIWAGALRAKVRPHWSYESLAIIMLAWFGSSMFWVERPAFVGMLPLLISYVVLDKDEELNFKDWLLLILINVFWVNIHGSWIILTAMIIWREWWRVILLRMRSSWQQVVATVALLLSSLINPFGYKVFSYIFKTASISLERGIDEWAPPSLFGGYPSQAVIYFVLVTCAVFYFFKSSGAKRKQIFSSPFTLIFLMSFISIRNTALPFYLLIPFTAKYILTKKSETEPLKKTWINPVVIAVLVLLCIVFFPTVKPHLQNILPETKKALYDASTPVAFAKKLNETSDSDPVFNEWDYGSYLILSQKHPIFIDTRNIIYGRDEYNEYRSVIKGEKNWEEILSKYNVRYMLLSKRYGNNLIKMLELKTSWEKMLEDKNTVLFGRVKK